MFPSVLGSSYWISDPTDQVGARNATGIEPSPSHPPRVSYEQRSAVQHC